MDGGLWDFEAPTFVDFQAKEHEKNDGAEEYFSECMLSCQQSVLF